MNGLILVTWEKMSIPMSLGFGKIALKRVLRKNAINASGCFQDEFLGKIALSLPGRPGFAGKRKTFSTASKTGALTSNMIIQEIPVLVLIGKALPYLPLLFLSSFVFVQT